MEEDRPKIGLALSGASSRATFYIGFLEVLTENSIPIDYIAASSSGSLVAMAYACGTLPQFKDHALRLDKEMFKDIIGKASVNRRGLYSMDNMEEVFRFYSRGLRFDEVKPILAFTAVDIDQGKEVLLSMGDIAHAARISCTLPGIFEPMEWGGGQLVDGGLLNIIPLGEVKRFGTDIAIGFNIPGARHIFKQEHLQMRKLVRFVKHILSMHRTRKLISNAYAAFAGSGYVEIEIEQDESQYQSVFSVLGRCMDLAIEAEKGEYRVDVNPHTDFVITPMLPPGHLEGLKQTKYFYDEGRRTAELYVSKIEKAMKNYKEKKKHDKSFTITF